MWLGHSRGRAWSCDQCRANPKLRAQRGSCGGPFKQGLPLVQEDEEGRFVEGFRVCPDSGEDFSDLKIRSCPVAGANRMASIIVSYRRHQSGLLSIERAYPKPTCAIIEAFETLHINSESARVRAHERAMRESHGNQ